MAICHTVYIHMRKHIYPVIHIDMNRYLKYVCICSVYLYMFTIDLT